MNDIVIVMKPPHLGFRYLDINISQLDICQVCSTYWPSHDEVGVYLLYMCHLGPKLYDDKII